MDYSNFNCSICDASLENHNGNAICYFCNKEENSEWLCENGHYICNDCRIAEYDEILENVIDNTDLKNPYKIANKIMSHRSFNAHGIEHHFLVPAVILTSLRKQNVIDIDTRKILTVTDKIKDIPYGACGSRGICGACGGAGLAISEVIKANYKKGKERSIVLLTTSTCLNKLADLGGPRCCKQSVYMAIETFFEIYSRKVDYDINSYDPKCVFLDKIEECKKEECIYYEL